MNAPMRQPEELRRRILALLIRRPKTTKELTALIKAWDVTDIETILIELRNEGMVGCTNKRWWYRQWEQANLKKVQGE